MKCLDFDWQINEFMVYCRSTQLRERTMYSYEQTLRLFERRNTALTASETTLPKDAL